MRDGRPDKARKINTQLGLDWARAFRERMKPTFDAIDARGGYLDSAARYPHLRVRAWPEGVGE